MKITFKIILIITIIFFSKESLDGGLCESNTDCDPNEKEGECKDIKDGFGYCACMEGYNRGGDNNKCIKYVNYNETCDLEHDLCGDINQFCWNGNKCTCRSMSIYSNETKKCEKILFYGEFCLLGGVCLGNPNLECSTVTFNCTCLNGYEYNEYFKRCQKTVNYEESCDNYNIVCGEKLSCNTQKCGCYDGYTYNSTEKICQRTAEFGDSCDNKYDVCGENLECNNKICICPEGYEYSDKDSKCIIEGEGEEDSDYSKFIKFNILFFILFLFL